MKILLLTFILVVFGLVGAYFYQQGTLPSTSTISDIVQNQTGNISPLKKPTTAPDSPLGSPTILAGKSSKLYVFRKPEFEEALDSKKVVFLYFYANWCPTCKVEFPVAMAAFDELTTPNVIGFRVNYNDNQTDEYEKKLASDYGVNYQHTKVAIKNRQRILKSPETWDKNRYLLEIEELAK